jgi:hypothetical protein
MLLRVAHDLTDVRKVAVFADHVNAVVHLTLRGSLRCVPLRQYDPQAAATIDLDQLAIGGAGSVGGAARGSLARLCPWTTGSGRSECVLVKVVVPHQALMTRQAALHGWLAGTGIKSERQWPHLGQRWAVRPGCPPDGSIAATRSIVFSQRLHWGSSVEGADFMRDSLVRHLTYATVDFAHSTKLQIPPLPRIRANDPAAGAHHDGPKGGKGA